MACLILVMYSANGTAGLCHIVLYTVIVSFLDMNMCE